MVLPRWAETPQRLSELAAEVVRNNVDVIVTQGTPAARAAKRATNTIPIVMATSGDPVALGLVASLARPGGNVTGNTILAPDLNGKRLELIRELVPGISRIAVLANPANPATAVDIKAAQAAAKGLGLLLQVLEVREQNDFDRAFTAAGESGATALLVQADPFILANRARIAKLAVASRLPAVGGISRGSRGLGRLRTGYHGDVPAGSHVYRQDPEGRRQPICRWSSPPGWNWRSTPGPRKRSVCKYPRRSCYGLIA